MANFNPGLNPTNDPNYSGESRLDRAAFQDQLGAVTAEERRRKVATVANSANTLLDTANWGIEQSAEEALKSGVDPIRNEQGGDTYGLENQPQNKAQNPGMAPPAVSRYAEGVTKLHAQYDQGVISDSRYYEQLEVLTRQVKARFPGYEDHIDKTIHRITGVTPANALREARLTELKATASESQKKADKDETFFHQNIKYLPPNWKERSADENYESIRQGQRATEDQERAIRLYNIAEHERSASDDEKRKLANSVVTSTMDEFRRTTQPIIDEAIAKVESGKSVDPKDAEALAQNYEFNLRANVHEKLSKMNVTGEEYNRLMNMAMEDTKLFRQTLISGDASMLKQQQLHIQSMADEKYRRLYEDSDLVQKMELLKKLPQPIQAQISADFSTKITGPLVDQLGLTRAGVPGGSANAAELPKETKAALGAIRMDNATSFLGAANRMKQMRPIDQLHKLGEFPSGKSGDAVQTFVNDWAHVMTNESLPDEVKKAAVARFFKEDNMDFLKEFNTATDKQAVYRTFTSPLMVQQMQKLKGTHEYDLYSAWVKQNFHHVFKSEIDNLAGIADRPFVNLDFNESTGKFLLVPSEEGRRVADEEARKAGRPSLVGTMNGLERLYGQAPLEKSVNELNAVMQNVKPFIEGENYTFSDEIKNLIHFEATHDKKNFGFWSTFFKNTTEGVRKFEDETFGGQNINFSEPSGTPGGSYKQGMKILQEEGGFPKHIAQGMMANLKIESGFDTKAKGDGGKAAGIAQWHPDRQAQFRRYWGKDIKEASFEEQTRFVLWELDHMESAAKAKIMKAETAAEAAALIDQYYERSSGEHREKRVKQALAYAAQD